jgi:hypothetical protein
VARERKKNGYGTGVVAKEPGTISAYQSLTEENDPHFEILPLDVKLSANCREGRIVVYRSPSMDDPDEIRKFYEIVGRYLKHMRGCGLFDCITYIGDPNKHSSSIARIAEEALMVEHQLVNLIGDMPTRIDNGRETQPDSCYVWFDPSKVTVSAAVEGKIHSKMDHRMIRLKYKINGQKPEKRSFFTFNRRVRDKAVSDSQVSDFFKYLLEQWHDSYAPFIYDLENNLREGVNFDGSLVDFATDELFDICRHVRDFMSKDVMTRLPNSVSRKDGPDRVKIGQLSALLSEFSYKIMQNPDNVEYRRTFVRIEKEKSDLMDKFTQKLIESNMKHMCEKIKPGTRKFFGITEKLLAKDKFSENSTDRMSESERKERGNLVITSLLMKSRTCLQMSKSSSVAKSTNDPSKLTPSRKLFCRS